MKTGRPSAEQFSSTENGSMLRDALGDQRIVSPGTTLKLRLSLIITVLLALLTITGGVYVVRKARDDVREEVRSTLNLTGHFLDAQLDVLRDHWSAHGYAVPLFQLR